MKWPVRPDEYQYEHCEANTVSRSLQYSKMVGISYSCIQYWYVFLPVREYLKTSIPFTMFPLKDNSKSAQEKVNTNSPLTNSVLERT
jgi:hypothetical protein